VLGTNVPKQMTNAQMEVNVNLGEEKQDTVNSLKVKLHQEKSMSAPITLKWIASNSSSENVQEEPKKNALKLMDFAFGTLNQFYQVEIKKFAHINLNSLRMKMLSRIAKLSRIQRNAQKLTPAHSIMLQSSHLPIYKFVLTNSYTTNKEISLIIAEAPLKLMIAMEIVSGTNVRTTMVIKTSHAQPKKHHIASK